MKFVYKPSFFRRKFLILGVLHKIVLSKSWICWFWFKSCPDTKRIRWKSTDSDRLKSPDPTGTGYSPLLRSLYLIYAFSLNICISFCSVCYSSIVIDIITAYVLKSSDPFYIVTYHLKWVTTYWTYSSTLIMHLFIDHIFRSFYI